MSAEHPHLYAITKYGINWKNQARLALFERLMELYPNVFSPDSPKPLAVGIREPLLDNLEQIVEGMPLEYRKTALQKVVKAYVQSEAYLQAVMNGEPPINLQGEIEGENTDERREYAKHIWWKKYDPTRVVTPPPAPKPKTPPPKKTLKLKPKPKPKPKPVKRPSKKKRKGQKPSKPASPRMRGTITHYIEDLGFGFLSLLEGGPRIFFHKNAIKHSQLDTQQLIGQRVTFRVIEGKSGPNSFSAIKIQFDDS